MAKKRGSRGNRGNRGGGNRGNKGSMADKISEMEERLRQEQPSETNTSSAEVERTSNPAQSGINDESLPLPIPPKAPERGLTNSERYEFAQRTPIERGRAKPVIIGNDEAEEGAEPDAQVCVATASPVIVHAVPKSTSIESGSHEDEFHLENEGNVKAAEGVGLGTINSGLPDNDESSSQQYEEIPAVPDNHPTAEESLDKGEATGEESQPKDQEQEYEGSLSESNGFSQLSPVVDTAKNVSTGTNTGTTTPAESWQDVPSPAKLDETPREKSAPVSSEVIGVCVVGFHATRGPEVEYWAGPRNMSDVWPYLPFQSLPDGSHQFEESLCYFTLLYDEKKGTAPSLVFQRDEEGHIADPAAYRNVRTLFAASCCRRESSSDEARGVVQKAVVVIAKRPLLGPVKEKLTVVTRSYFAQSNFEDRSIIDGLYLNLQQQPFEPDVTPFMRNLIHRFKENALVLFKAMLAEAKILFYSEDSERLCMTQFSLVALIPGLLNHLEDCGSPLLSTYETQLSKPALLKTSDRDNLLRFVGLPLQLFGGGGLFSPFVPLQQLSDLRERESAFGLVGTTNHVFLESTDQFDIVVNIDKSKIERVAPELTSALQLSGPDRRFIQAINKTVDRSWTDEESERWFPSNLGYEGSDDYIRREFENYLTGLLSSAKYDQHINSGRPKRQNVPNRPLEEYGGAFAERWCRTNNFRIFNKFTDDELFDVISPEHPGMKLGRKFLFWQK